MKSRRKTLCSPTQRNGAPDLMETGDPSVTSASPGPGCLPQPPQVPTIHLSRGGPSPAPHLGRVASSATDHLHIPLAFSFVSLLEKDDCLILVTAFNFHLVHDRACSYSTFSPQCVAHHDEVTRQRWAACEDSPAVLDIMSPSEGNPGCLHSQRLENADSQGSFISRLDSNGMH